MQPLLRNTRATETGASVVSGQLVDRAGPRPLWWTLSIIWLVILAGGPIALRQEPFTVAIGAALVAGAIEASLYAATGFERAREWVRRLPHRGVWITASGLPAYLIYSAGAGTFHWKSFVVLVVAGTVVGLWFEWLPNNAWTDAGFLALMACGLLTELAVLLYPPLSAKLKTDYIGRILWLRLGYWAVLAVRERGRGSDYGFGFVPRRKDWVIGFRYSLYCIVVAAGVLALVQPMRLKDHLSWGLTPWVALGTFAGFLWVVALSEELFTRGILQGNLTRVLGSEWAGVIVTSGLFGLAHLTYSHEFPNWRMVTLAGVLGLFCGRAAQVAGGIRASMVTHALVVTVFRVFLTKR